MKLTFLKTPSPVPAKKVLCIVLPNGKRVTLASYAMAWRWLSRKQRFDPYQLVNGFSDFPMSVTDILKEMSSGLHDRINKHTQRKGRKFSEEYQTGLMRDCMRVRDRVTKRVRFYQLETKELKAKFSHLLSSYSD